MEQVVEHLPAREIAIRELNSLRGRLFSAIESAGLPVKQERALILTIKNLSFQNQYVIERLIDNLPQADEDGNPLTFKVIDNRVQLD